MSESRKVVTIVFADVTGSTALGEQVDPEAMRRIMERYFAEMRAVLERHGGTVEKFIGDAVMAVFGIPAVHEDDALRAVRAAVEMRESLATLNEEFGERGVELGVRTGLNTGEVVAGDPAQGQAFATGDAVNVAARLEQAAEPGEILIGSLTHRLASEAIRAEAMDSLELKGKSEPVEAWRLIEILPDAPALTRRIDAPFVGREGELAALLLAFERTREGGSCELVTVTGAPGIGKSRLVRELLGSVRGEARVVIGRCLSYGEGITYWPLAEIVREVAGADPRTGLGDLLGAEPEGVLAIERLLAAIGGTEEAARTEEIFWATRKLLERLGRERPLIVVIDDIHWAEPTLLDLLEYLVGFTHAPVLVACTARPELFDLRPHWPRAQTIDLDALDDAEASALIDALLTESDLQQAVRELIKARSEGNPLFVEQMLALAAENGSGEIAVPATIQALLAARLDQLPSTERAVLVRGAVEGRLFHRGTVSAMLAEAEQDGLSSRLLTLARKAFVRPDESLFPGDDAFRFVHVLVRDAAYDGAPKELRAELHERFADWLVETVPDRLSELEEILGYHLEQSCRYRLELGEQPDELARRAGEHLGRAGERALLRGDSRAAANLLERAFGFLPRGSAGRLELVWPLGRALTEGGRLEDARRIYGETVDDARAAGSEAVALRAEIALNRVARSTDPAWSGEEALALVERALPVLEAAGDDPGLAQAWDAVHDVEWTRGNLAAARAAAERALAHAERVADPHLIADHMEGIGACMWFGDTSLSELAPYHHDFLDWARRFGYRSVEGTLVWVFGQMYIEQGRQEEGKRLCEEGLAIIEELGLALRRAELLGLSSLGDLASDPERAEARARAAYETLKALGETSLLSTRAAWLAIMLTRRGALDEAEALATESERSGADDDVFNQVSWRIAKAMLLARRMKVAEANAVAREAETLANQTEYTNLRASASLGLADVLRHSGKVEEAAGALAEALRIFERKEMDASAAVVRAQLAELQSVGSAAP